MKFVCGAVDSYVGWGFSSNNRLSQGADNAIICPSKLGYQKVDPKVLGVGAINLQLSERSYLNNMKIIVANIPEGGLTVNNWYMECALSPKIRETIRSLRLHLLAIVESFYRYIVAVEDEREILR